MKLLPYLLLNLIVVAGGLLVYDQLRGEEPHAPVALESARHEDLGGIEARLAALEADRRPLLRTQGTDARVLERLTDLERRVQALPSTPEDPPASETGATDTGLALAAAGEEPTPEAVRRFRKLQEAASREERIRVSRDRIKARTAKLGVHLTDKQQERLVEAYDAFQPRVSEIWTEVKTRAASVDAPVDWATILSETSVVIQREFVGRISAFVPAGDAETLAAALYTRGK